MREVNIRIRGADRIRPIIAVDGKQLKYKKNDFATYEAKFQTDKDKIEVCLYKYLEISGKLWWLMSIIFFLLSCFGIFDFVRDKKCIVVDCKFVLDLKSSENNKFDIICNVIKDSGRAVEIETDYQFVEERNYFYIDQVAKKRLKIMKGIKFAILVVAVVCLGLLISKI